MKERPIIFSGPMVRAILEGRKTQTRRVVKPQPDEDGLSFDPMPPSGSERGWYDTNEKRYRCPYGEPGDQLWVKETFALSIFDPETIEPDPKNPDDWSSVSYRADGDSGNWTMDEVVDGELVSTPIKAPWRPSIFMPRWASRLQLAVRAVRVEWLQAITEADARAEGVIDVVGDSPAVYQTAVDGFHDLWDSINDKRGFPWASNPWVWVVEFELLEQGNGGIR